MQISKEELQKIVKEEVNEIFGFGKKKEAKEYPASELAAIIRGLDDASKRSGAELTPSQREAIVDELTGVLEDEGFVIKENERLFTGEEDVVVTHQNAPKLKVFLDTIAQKSPKVFKQLLGVFNRSALDISPVVKSMADNIPSILTVADPEPDEDQTDTIVTEPVAAPDDEDQTDTIVAEPVAAPDDEDQTATVVAEPVAAPDDEDQTDTIVTEPVAAPDPDDDEDQTDTIAIGPLADPEGGGSTQPMYVLPDVNDLFLSLDDESIEEFLSSVPREYFKWGTMRISDEALFHLFDGAERSFGWSPQDTRNARQNLDDDQYAALETAVDNDLSVEEVRQILRRAEQTMVTLAKDAKETVAKRNRITEHKQLKRMKVLAGIK